MKRNVVCLCMMALLLATSARVLAAGKPFPHPCARGYATMVYDEKTGQAYLLGGCDQLQMYYNLFDVWSYNSFTGRWKQLFQDSDGSFFNAFQADGMALDSRSKKIVSLATFVDTPSGVETWIYDLHSNTFENVTSGTEPSNRWLNSICYDPVSHRAILFGGFDAATYMPLNDTWAYDFKTNTWTNLQPAMSPPGRGGHYLVYHPLARKIILHGGGDETTVGLTDTWAYDSIANTWTECHPAVHPNHGGYARLAYDLWSNRIISFGGVLSGENWPHEQTSNETWAYSYENDTWTLLDPRVSPGNRAWQSTVGTWAGPVIFSGGPDRMEYTDDTWIYNSFVNTWKKINSK